MATTLTTATANATVDVLDDQVNAGTTDATGDLFFTSASDTERCSITLQNPAFDAGGTGGAGIITLLGVPLTSSTTAAADTITKGKFRNRDNTEVYECAVATAGSDINLTDNVLGIGDAIRIDSLTVTVAGA